RGEQLRDGEAETASRHTRRMAPGLATLGNPRVDADPQVLCRRCVRQRLRPRDYLAQLAERRVALPAGREVRFEGGLLGAVEFAVDVFRKPTSPLIVHRSKCLRSAIRA